MTISWERARSIFGNAPPPRRVWERQFDHFNEELRQLCRTPWAKIDLSDLWYYYHDLSYVELQPEVFAYLFPACLMAWHESLMANRGCGAGDAEFHYSLWYGKILERMMTAEQRIAVSEFFRDSFLMRLDRERGFVYQGSETPAYAWMLRFNSLGIIMPRIDLILTPMWAIETPGRAVAAIQYLSGLIYPLGHNPLFPAWTPEEGGGDPPLLNHDSNIVDSGWNAQNIQLLRQILTLEYIEDALHRAVCKLKDEPEWDLARRAERDFSKYRDICETRVEELPELLSSMDLETGWSM